MMRIHESIKQMPDGRYARRRFETIRPDTDGQTVFKLQGKPVDFDVMAQINSVIYYPPQCSIVGDEFIWKSDEFSLDPEDEIVVYYFQMEGSQ